MPRPFLIIDGYNLLHAAGMARDRYGPGDLERCRNRLLNFLAGRLTATERSRTTVVFDAGAAPSDIPRTLTLHEMQVRFAAAGGDADTLIEELVAQHSSPRQVRVVSSDHRLQRAARHRRATAVESRDFFRQLDQRPARLDPHPQGVVHPKFSGNVPSGDVAHWLEVFGSLDGLDAHLPDEPSLPEPPSPSKKTAPPAKPPATRPASPLPKNVSPHRTIEPSDDAELSRPASVCSDEELKFWRARVAELADEEDSPAGRRQTPPKRPPPSR